MSEKVLDKFLRYAKIDTQSDDSSTTTPSTAKQFDLGNLLHKELLALGLKDAEIDEHCYVMATIPSNLPSDHPAYGKVPTIGFVAHVDTSPDVTDTNVKPQIIENYQGGDIVLPADTSIVIRESENPELANSIGHTLVTTDGTTLLGSDDKAGVAAIMKMAEIFMEDNSILHGDIRIGFTPDEEIGQGTKFFNIKKFGCKYAYTIDGEMPGELNKETFSANGGVIRIKGRDIHPGSAKNIMVNATRVAGELIARFPRNMAPETTEGHEPYIHPHSVEGGIGEATIKILFRDFRTEGLAVQEEILEKVIAEVQEMYPKAEIKLDVKEQYRNMLDTLEKNPEVLDNLWEAAELTGTNPYWKPIRGGTDGSRLTEMGLPTPNIYNGGNNFHSKSEWLNVNALEKTVDTIINVAKVYVEKAK
ncbi:MAG: peptidase T [Ignavibacteria bacterium GWF2_33_9]|nr:MAG: peptidase T [Ignavibacteria bacterium GWF2_33_9]